MEKKLRPTLSVAFSLCGPFLSLLCFFTEMILGFLGALSHVASPLALLNSLSLGLCCKSFPASWSHFLSPRLFPLGVGLGPRKPRSLHHKGTNSSPGREDFRLHKLNCIRGNIEFRIM